MATTVTIRDTGLPYRVRPCTSTPCKLPDVKVDFESLTETLEMT